MKTIFAIMLAPLFALGCARVEESSELAAVDAAAPSGTGASDEITLEEIGQDENDLAADQQDALEAQTELSFTDAYIDDLASDDRAHDDDSFSLADALPYAHDVQPADNIATSQHIKIDGCREVRKNGSVRTAAFRLREHTTGERKDAKFIGHVATAIGVCVKKGQTYKQLKVRVVGLKPGKRYFLVGRIWARNENKPGLPFTLWRWGFSNDFSIENGKATPIKLPLPIHTPLPPQKGGGQVAITQ